MPRHVHKLTLTAALVSGALVLGGLAGCNRTESTATLLAEAKAYQDKGDRKAALIQLKNAVAQSPEDGEARFLLGSLHLDSGDAVSAEKELRKAASLGIASERTLPLLARALQNQGQSDKVLEEVTLEKAKGSAALMALRGDALLEQRKTDEAKQAYDAALQLDPATGEALIGLARHALFSQDTAAAERYALEAVTKDAKNADAWLFQGGILRALNKTDEAMKAYDQVIALRPHDRSAYVEKAYIQINQGKFDAAKASIEAARKNAPGNLLATYAQGLLDYTQGKHAEAQESLQKVLKASPDHLPSILLSGAVELNLGALQQAELHLRKYLASNPDNVFARKLLAQTLLKSSQPKDAVDALAPVLKDAGNDPQLLALAGQSYMQVRDFDKATSYFEKASELAPKVAAIRTSLGLSRLGQGDRDKGLSDLQAGATLDPKSPDGGMALVQAELGMKNYDKALAAAKQLAKQQPNNAQVHNLLGLVHLAKQDAASARAAFEESIRLQPAFYPAATALAELDMRDKKIDSAKARFNGVLKADPKHVGAMTALAQIALYEKKPAEATTWLEKASNDNPGAVAPIVKLGSHYLSQNEPQKALNLARKASTENPTQPDLLELLGQAQLASKDGAGALETYSKLVKVLPKSAMAQYRLANAHVALKNESAAAEDIKRALALQPDFLPAHLAQVELAMRAKKPEQALESARALQKQPNNAAVGYVLEGDLLTREKKQDQALAMYEKAYALQPSSKVLLTIHRAMLASGKEAQADARLADWMKKNPNDMTVIMYQAERSLTKGQLKQAAAQFETIVKAAPNNGVALNNLAWTYQQLKDPRALETAEQAYRASGDHPAVMDTLGAILVERGDLKRAVPLLQKGVNLAPNSGDLRLHLAQALIKSGDKAGAKKELELLASKGNGPGAEQAKELLKQL
ncbi:XrtA/PEP-CTERM system TPR-repeat protein PrsT [Massilia sp. DD77]|uniref:XrtA/PEP-CTERM system TPR-repeat protein PrsT n=1 Tax=Massilia sp. DD77 TaxID=3109349 RepID=UPI003000B06D